MKLKATKKEIKQNYPRILRVGYCHMQALLRFQNPFAYSGRAEDWACDYYDVQGICISTGYAPIGTSVDHSILDAYEKQAQDLQDAHLYHYDERVVRTNALLLEFMKAVTI